MILENVGPGNNIRCHGGGIRPISDCHVCQFFTSPINCNYKPLGSAQAYLKSLDTPNPEPSPENSIV
jgi:hypothetical protein